MDKVLLRIEEAAEALSLGRSKTYELIQRGQLRTVKIGKSTRVPAHEVAAFAGRFEAASRSRRHSYAPVNLPDLGRKESAPCQGRSGGPDDLAGPQASATS